jgi:glycosyltransferase involved in cell wall biosynthesis
MTLLRDLFPAGAEIPNTYSFPLTAYLARILHNRGHEITLFALSKDIPATLRIEGDRITAYFCAQRRNRYRILDFSRRERHDLRDAMKASGCSVIHAFWTYEFGSAAIACGLPHVVTAQDIPTVVMRFARDPYSRVYPLLGWPVLRKAKCVTTVSPYAAGALRGYVAPGRDIIVVPNGVAQDVFDRFDARRPHSKAAPFTFAAILQGWSGRKNGQRLIEAFGTLRKEFGEQTRLLMFGSGHERNGPAHRWSTRRGLAAGVEFLGPLPNGIVVNRLAEEVDALVHPSLEETFGVAAAEAMAVGIPVIGGLRSGAIPWVLGDGKAGLLVDVTSAAAMAAAMRSLIQEPNLRNSMARLGRERAIKEFRLEAIAQQYEDVIGSALQDQAS